MDFLIQLRGMLLKAALWEQFVGVCQGLTADWMLKRLGGKPGEAVRPWRHVRGEGWELSVKGGSGRGMPGG